MAERSCRGSLSKCKRHFLHFQENKCGEHFGFTTALVIMKGTDPYVEHDRGGPIRLLT